MGIVQVQDKYKDGIVHWSEQNEEIGEGTHQWKYEDDNTYSIGNG